MIDKSDDGRRELRDRRRFRAWLAGRDGYRFSDWEIASWRRTMAALHRYVLFEMVANSVTAKDLELQTRQLTEVLALEVRALTEPIDLRRRDPKTTLELAMQRSLERYRLLSPVHDIGSQPGGRRPQDPPAQAGHEARMLRALSEVLRRPVDGWNAPDPSPTVAEANAAAVKRLPGADHQTFVGESALELSRIADAILAGQNPESQLRLAQRQDEWSLALVNAFVDRFAASCRSSDVRLVVMAADRLVTRITTRSLILGEPPPPLVQRLGHRYGLPLQSVLDLGKAALSVIELAQRARAESRTPHEPALAPAETGPATQFPADWARLAGDRAFVAWMGQSGPWIHAYERDYWAALAALGAGDAHRTNRDLQSHVHESLSSRGLNPPNLVILQLEGTQALRRRCEESDLGETWQLVGPDRDRFIGGLVLRSIGAPRAARAGTARERVRTLMEAEAAALADMTDAVSTYGRFCEVAVLRGALRAIAFLTEMTQACAIALGVPPPDEVADARRQFPIEAEGLAVLGRAGCDSLGLTLGMLIEAGSPVVPVRAPTPPGVDEAGLQRTGPIAGLLGSPVPGLPPAPPLPSDPGASVIIRLTALDDRAWLAWLTGGPPVPSPARDLEYRTRLAAVVTLLGAADTRVLEDVLAGQGLPARRAELERLSGLPPGASQGDEALAGLLRESIGRHPSIRRIEQAVLPISGDWLGRRPGDIHDHAMVEAGLIAACARALGEPEPPEIQSLSRPADEFNALPPRVHNQLCAEELLHACDQTVPDVDAPGRGIPLDAARRAQNEDLTRAYVLADFLQRYPSADRTDRLVLAGLFDEVAARIITRAEALAELALSVDNPGETPASLTALLQSWRSPPRRGHRGPGGASVDL